MFKIDILSDKMNRHLQMKVMENNIVSGINSLKDEISNLKEIVIKNLQNDNENLDRKVRNWRDVQSMSLTIMLRSTVWSLQ